MTIKLGVFSKQPTQTGTRRISLKNVSIDDVEGQGSAATM